MRPKSEEMSNTIDQQYKKIMCSYCCKKILFLKIVTQLLNDYNSVVVLHEPTNW